MVKGETLFFDDFFLICLRISYDPQQTTCIIPTQQETTNNRTSPYLYD
jgi:hypothetical protein